LTIILSALHETRPWRCIAADYARDSTSHESLQAGYLEPRGLARTPIRYNRSTVLYEKTSRKDVEKRRREKTSVKKECLPYRACLSKWNTLYEWTVQFLVTCSFCVWCCLWWLFWLFVSDGYFCRLLPVSVSDVTYSSGV
jgi:hypothetical protein